MTYTLKGFGPLISLLPYQFGFTPIGSHVVAFFDGNMLEACARFDADDDFEHSDELTQLCAEMCAKRSISGAVVIAYEIGKAAGRHNSAVARQVRNAGLSVHHQLEVRDERWRVQTCELHCCDMTWQAIEHPSDVGPVAEMVVRGIAPLSSRSQALAVLTRRDDVARKSLAETVAALHEAGVRGTMKAPACPWCSYANAPLTNEGLLAHVVVAFQDGSCRDKAIWSLVPELAGASLVTDDQSPGGVAGRDGHVCRIDELTLCIQRLLEALPAIQDDLRPTWLCLIALARWRSGDHSGAAMAACCATDEAPRHALAQICLRILETRSPYENFCNARGRTSSSL